MNNKKLFKGALVFFASILMAVSCSSNSNPDDGKGNGNSDTGGNTETPDNRPTLVLNLKAGENGSDPSTTKLGIVLKQTFDTDSLKAKTPISLEGKDSTSLTSTGYKAKVVSIKGYNTTPPTQKSKGTATIPGDFAFSSATSQQNFSTLNITTKELEGIVLKVEASKVTVESLSKEIATKLATALTTESGTGAAEKFGVISMQIEISKNDGTVKPITLTVNFDVAHAAS